jgi:hypothetical protein
VPVVGPEGLIVPRSASFDVWLVIVCFFSAIYSPSLVDPNIVWEIQFWMGKIRKLHPEFESSTCQAKDFALMNGAPFLCH